MLETLKEIAIRLGLLPAPQSVRIPVRQEAPRRDPW